jgi:iron complex outermembrane receptor protein
MLEDVERIEVIRGPGSTLWGANAVNGVINIITKNSEDTQGGLLTGGAGDKAERVVGGFRYGGKISKDAYYRLYARYFDHDNFNISTTSPGDNSNDNWQISQGGFRIDWDLSPVDTLTLKGDIYGGDVNELTRSSLRRLDKNVSGVNVLGRWKHIFSDTSDMSFQMYYDRTYRKEDVFFREIRDTFDLDYQHRFRFDRQHELIWGLGYRYSTDDFNSFSTTTLNPDREGLHLFSAFVQDEISLIDDHLQLTLGTKIEYNDFTGLELQPNVRVLWSPTQRQKVWAAISRAVRTPNRSENDIRTTTGSSIVLGNEGFDSEDVLAFELGYRVQPLKSLAVDIATFFNIYDDLQTVETGIDPFSGLSSFIVHNKMDGETFGLEISTEWNVTDSWKLTAGYTYLQMQLHLDDTSTDIGKDVTVESSSPQNQGSLRSNLDLPYNLELDNSLNYVDHLGTGDISSYLRLDARLGWQPTESIDVSIGMRNLLDDDHAEFRGPSGGLIKTEIERSIFAKITWRF